MPRLVGQRSNTGANITSLIILLAIFGVLSEYFGVIDIVPGFGREGQYFQLKFRTTNEQIIQQPNQ
ncbi:MULTISPECIES: hypothetical protein [unclassified Nostoc]|uniref:hypothetical protein n=1 Tax=unclassified Nostoc TaxID=2593658 RepID=UPI0025AAD83A|nr:MULTISPECIES: hypothetical protein [unclassified Nostoc]MDM9584180.1 hypothetical protein [Nostoc sp. GT001]MDZ7947829.1 hypothetical protein [Nostoc sp. EfeVER01]MDZ7994373.1 hypothetical protein [Nostoc sp. EspVER01]